ncbi:coiled-coil domain-containing protein 170-like [Trichechus manatus latirostris]|uniref:Coiled-coil domain-containing protein 170-like n=1 Tax=Trichechus manatus latirostris TaxID=127582 RepID=A0A2Y9DBV4_TRIMA|nr:coiled-coil domain-containing protein 170-like [Trichechus manatus latirostris]
MSDPVQFLNHSDPGRLTVTGQSKGPHEAKPSEVTHLSAHTSQRNSPVAGFDPPLEVVPAKNPIRCNKRAADPVHPDLAGLLVKNKNLLAELRNVQNKLLIKETSLQEMRSELESYKENNVQQLFQIMSLKDDIKDLEELIASLTRIKSLKNTDIQSLERGNWDLTEQIIELENRLRVHLVEREKAERKADFLEKKLSANRCTRYMNMKGQEDSMDIFMTTDNDEAILAKNLERDIFHFEGPKNGQKISDKCLQDLIHKEEQISQLDKPPYSFCWETKKTQSQYQNFLDHLATLQSNSVVPIAATEEAVKQRIQEIVANRQSWKSRTEGLQQEIQILNKRMEQLHHLYEEVIQESSQAEEKCREEKKSLKCLEGKIAINDLFQAKVDLDRKKENSRTRNSQIEEHDEKFKQLEKDEKQIFLRIQQNVQIATTQRLEKKVQKLQKQLSDLKLSNKNMKTQLTRVNVLKNKTMEKLRRSLTEIETMKEKAVMKTDNMKTPLDCGEQEARSDRERVHQILGAVTRKLDTAESKLEDTSGREQELADFRETIMKILRFNMKTADKEVINQLRLIIQAYEASNKKSKIASDGAKLECDSRTKSGELANGGEYGFEEKR